MEIDKSAIQIANELDLASKELGVLDIKYLPSPKSSKTNIKDLTKSATFMLKNYKDYLDGKPNTGIKEIL